MLRHVVYASLLQFGVETAQQYDVNANQLFKWLKLYNDDRQACGVASASQLIPVVVTADQDALARQPSGVAEKIEIVVAGKYRVRVATGLDAQALRRVLDVLEPR
jgi:transposase